VPYFLDFLVLLSIVAWVVALTAAGSISTQHAGLVVAALAVALAVARATGSGLIRLTLRIGVPVASLAALVAWYGGGDLRRTADLLGAVMGLTIAAFGMYFLVRGALPRRP
jgi:hypothetical protein